MMQMATEKKMTMSQILSLSANRLGAIYGYEQIGIVQANRYCLYAPERIPMPGYPKYKDIDGVPGITAADRKILGYQKENFRMNMSNTIRYKNFELYAMVTGIFGGDGYYLQSNKEAFTANQNWNYQNRAGIPYWTPENKSNIYPVGCF